MNNSKSKTIKFKALMPAKPSQAFVKVFLHPPFNDRLRQNTK